MLIKLLFQLQHCIGSQEKTLDDLNLEGLSSEESRVLFCAKLGQQA